MRRFLTFLIYAAMFGGGLVLCSSFLFHPVDGSEAAKRQVNFVAIAAGLFLLIFGGYLIWSDFIASAFRGGNEKTK